MVRTQLANGWGAGTGYTGTVWIPTAGNGCTALTAAGKCTAMAAIGANYGDGSVEGAGGNPPASTYIPTVVGSDTWTSFSKTTTNLQLSTILARQPGIRVSAATTFFPSLRSAYPDSNGR